MSRRKRQSTTVETASRAAVSAGQADTPSPALGYPPREPATSDPSASRLAAMLGMLVGVITFCVYIPAIRHDFLAVDDDQAVYANPHINDVGYFWLHPYFRLYTPVTSTIYVIIAALVRLPHAVATPVGGMSDMAPAAFHAANVIFHSLSTVMVFLLLRLLLPPNAGRLREAGSALGALLFGLHPMQVEPTAWVNGANNVFSGFFAVAALYLYTRHGLAANANREASSRRRAEKRAGGSRSIGPDGASGYLWLGAATVSFILALLGKPTAVTVPLAAWAIDAIILRRPWRESLPLLIWVALSSLIIQKTMGTQAGQAMIVENAPGWFRPFLMCDSLAFYLEKLVAPVNLGFDYGRSPDFVRLHTSWYVIWLLPAAVAAVLWWRRKEWPILLASAAIFAAFLFPTAGLVNSYFQVISVVTDRYIYLAMIGPALALAWAVTKWRHVAAPAVVVLVVFAAATSAQIRYWRNTYTIMSHTVSVSPNAWFARENLSTWLDRHGQPARAYPLIADAVRLGGHDPEGYGDLGRILGELGRNDEAADALRKAIDLEPPVPLPGTNIMGVTQSCLSDKVLLATILAGLGRRDEAISQLNEAIQYAPGYAPARDELATVETHVTPAEDEADEKANQARQLFKAGQHDQALALWNEALALNPHSEQAHGDLGVAYYELGRATEAVSELRAALDIKPDDTVNRINLGKILLAQKDSAGAIAQFQEVLRQQPDNAEAQAALRQATAGQP